MAWAIFCIFQGWKYFPTSNYHSSLTIQYFSSGESAEPFSDTQDMKKWQIFFLGTMRNSAKGIGHPTWLICNFFRTNFPFRFEFLWKNALCDPFLFWNLTWYVKNDPIKYYTFAIKIYRCINKISCPHGVKNSPISAQNSPISAKNSPISAKNSSISEEAFSLDFSTQ